MASRLFKAVGVGATMLRLSLIARGECRLRSSVSASTVWRGTTSPPGVPPRPVASSVSARGTGRGTASFVDRPGAFPRTECGSLQGAIFGVVPPVATNS
uniref:Uncharacterized protein n=1 Tax=Saccharum officinarum TaxID=4547 RepID=A0A678T689_SACOF|nr:hypothetical protein SO141L21_000006 [Saccharum officinarum]